MQEDKEYKDEKEGKIETAVSKFVDATLPFSKHLWLHDDAARRLFAEISAQILNISEDRATADDCELNLKDVLMRAGRQTRSRTASIFTLLTSIIDDGDSGLSLEETDRIVRRFLQLQRHETEMVHAAQERMRGEMDKQEEKHRHEIVRLQAALTSAKEEARASRTELTAVLEQNRKQERMLIKMTSAAATAVQEANELRSQIMKKKGRHGHDECYGEYPLVQSLYDPMKFAKALMRRTRIYDHDDID